MIYKIVTFLLLEEVRINFFFAKKMSRTHVEIVPIFFLLIFQTQQMLPLPCRIQLFEQWCKSAFTKHGNNIELHKNA